MKIFPATLRGGRPFLELQTIANLCAFCMIFHLSFYFSFTEEGIPHRHPWPQVAFVAVVPHSLYIYIPLMYSHSYVARKSIAEGTGGVGGG